MPPLRIEVFSSDDNQWHHAGDAPPRGASISANDPDGSRNVYVFSADEEHQQGIIEMSIGGVDEATPSERTIHALGFIPVAQLSDGESYELETVTDTSNGEIRWLRFTYYRPEQ